MKKSGYLVISTGYGDECYIYLLEDTNESADFIERLNTLDIDEAAELYSWYIDQLSSIHWSSYNKEWPFNDYHIKGVATIQEF